MFSKSHVEELTAKTKQNKTILLSANNKGAPFSSPAKPDAETQTSVNHTSTRSGFLHQQQQQQPLEETPDS
jgi:hypothetical protein